MNLIPKSLLKGFFYILYGDSIKIDASSLCQLNCPVCQSWRLKERVGEGYLKFLDFKNFVDKYRNFKKIELSNNGEIFLNPDLNSIIKYAAERNIELRANNGVNLNSISNKTIECLVKYKFGSISVSIDGASEKTYQIYRRGGNFHQAIENIKKINACKAKLCSSAPKLTWRFIVFGHNEHEIEQARLMARDLKMDFILLRNSDNRYSPIKNEAYVSLKFGFKTVKEWMENSYINANPYFFCESLWRDIQINWDGRLLGCCCNPFPFSANVFKDGMYRALKSEKYVYTKKMLSGKAKAEEKSPCYYCSNFIQGSKKGKHIKTRHIIKSNILSRIRTCINSLLSKL